MHNGDSYTTLGENKHLKRTVYIHSQGSFINQTAVDLSTHSISFLSTRDYKVVRLCQESSRCSAKGVRAMCVRKNTKYVTVESNGWGWVGRRGEMAGNGEREAEEQWETDLLPDSCSLSGACSQQICSPFCISHYLVPQDPEQDGVSV